MTEVTKGGYEYEYLSGKSGKHTQLFTPSIYNKYKIDLSLDNASLGKVLELKKRGIKNVIKNENGEYWLTISSPAKVDTRTGPRIIPPPAVVNPDGSDWDSKKGIGEGSDVTVKVWVRKYKNPNNQREEVALRLYGVKIDNLVNFDPKRDISPVGDAQKELKVRGLPEHGPQPW